MMQTNYILQMKLSTRPDLDYFYAGQNKEGKSVFELKKSLAKRYDFFEEADRDMRIIDAVHAVPSDTFEVKTIRCRT